jgi:hypothetical protein
MTGCVLAQESINANQSEIVPQVLNQMFWNMLLADEGGNAEFHDVAEHLSSNIGTAWVVAEVFLKRFFMAVGSCQACLDGYPRHGERP